MHWNCGIFLICCLLLSAACAHTELPSPTASPPPQSTVMLSTPFPPIVLPAAADQLAARLTDVESLVQAVEQLADLLTVPPERIRIRIRSKDCTVCNLAEDGAQSPPPLLTLTEAEKALSTYDLLWLVAQPLTCAYYYDGKRMTPRGCQVEASVVTP